MFDGISLLIWIVGPLVGLFGMFAGGYWGVGCGWLIVPVMLMLGLTPMEAVGIALLQMVPSTLPMVLRTAKEIPWRPGTLGPMILVPMGAGAFAASFAGDHINRWMYLRFGNSALMVLFAGVMIVIGLQTAFSHARRNPPQEQHFSLLAAGLALLSGLATGVFSSVLGVGGAVLMRPILASGFHVPEREVSVSVRILLLITTLTGGAAYLVHDGALQMRVLVLAVLISVGGMIGFPWGVRLHDLVAKCGYSQHIHKSFAGIAFIVVTGTLLKLAGFAEVGRMLMPVFALLLLGYLLGFRAYAVRHPRNDR